MATERRQAPTRHPSRPVLKKGPTATTIRLDPKLKVRLDGLRRLVKRPVNQLVNEAVERFIDQRAAEVGADLERALESVKALRARDPKFEGAIEQFVEAEATLGGHDPVEGKVTTSTAGPAERIVQELLRG
jgi:predicted DNA-binding protein